MTSITAFRTFFVSRGHNRAQQLPEKKPVNPTRYKLLLRHIFLPRLWRSRPTNDDGGEASGEDSYKRGMLPNIPHGSLTGIRTFINGRGKTANGSRILHSLAIEEEADTSSTEKHGHDQLITVSHDISLQSAMVLQVHLDCYVKITADLFVKASNADDWDYHRQCV